MQNLSLHSSATKNAPLDLAAEVVRLEILLTERRLELSVLQEEFHAFKARYTQVIGSLLAELALIETAIKEAEKRTLGVDTETDDEAAPTASVDTEDHAALPVGSGLRKLFWSVAKMFHPDYAADEGEARRRHAIMAEASRAYTEGDLESLHTLLGDEQLQSYCAAAHAEDDDEDIASRLLRLKDELRTVEFGIKRIRQDGLYKTKLSVDENAAHGRDSLAESTESINRRIAKARRRLAHLS